MLKFKVTYSTIIPDELQNELLSIGQMSKDGMFRIGEIANYLLGNINQYDGAVTREQIYSAVGAYCGKAARTIRDYATIASFYQPEIREDYDVLFFDHFRFAARYPNSWQTILDYAVNRVLDLGRPATVDELVAKFTFDNEEKEPEEFQDLNIHASGISNLRKAVNRAKDILRSMDYFKGYNIVEELLERAIHILEAE